MLIDVVAVDGVIVLLDVMAEAKLVELDTEVEEEEGEATESETGAAWPVPGMRYQFVSGSPRH